MKYYKAINELGDIYFIESGHSDHTPKDRVETAGWDCKIVEISEMEFKKLGLELNKRNKAMVGDCNDF